MLFYLGTHEPRWLAHVSIPLFVSRRRLDRVRRRPPIAQGPWALDSGGFTELSMFGGWQTTPAQYITDVRWAAQNIGRMQWAAPQDWMCEPIILAKTGKTVDDHQRLTVENFLTLRELAPELPIIPVLQGWSADDYLRCVERYDRAGVDLTKTTVGLGTVCRRQGTADAVSIVETVSRAVPGIRIHGFGFKTQGISLAHHMMESSDSLAWSFNARKNPPLPGCTHLKCASCLRWALRWRADLLARPTQPMQLAMFSPA